MAESSQAQDQALNLEPDFRFSPTDEEVITYVMYKFLDPTFSCIGIGDIELYSFEAPDLPGNKISIAPAFAWNWI